MYTYAQAETVLARMYGADEAAQRGAFRGRLKHLKRLGVPLDSAPGRGKKIQYDLDHVYQWAICLEFAELGIDPTVTCRFVREYWRVFRSYFRDASGDGESDVIFNISPRLMSRGWSEPVGLFSKAYPDFADHGVFQITDAEWLAGRLRGGSRRTCIINISELVRQVGRETVVLKGAE